ncbi:CHAT domain-containing protein [Flaviaesturariibacter terrae]
MRKYLLPFFLFGALPAAAQTEWDSSSMKMDTVLSAGGSYSTSGWSFETAEEYDATDFIQAKADQFYVSVERRPDSLPEVRWRFVQQHLRAGEVYLDFMLTEFNDKETFLTSVIRSTGLPQVLVIPKLTPGKTMEAVQAAARGISGGTAPSTSYLAYKNLMAYLEPQLEGAQTVYYSTSNELNLVNLRFLKCRDGRYFFEKYNLVRLHTAASFLGNRHRLLFPKKMKVLLVGNISYECDGASDDQYEPFWQPLPGSKLEINNIAALLKGVHQVDMLDSCKATEARFVEQINKTPYDILHLATHGFYFPPDGNARYRLTRASYPLLFTGIVLSGANSRKASAEPIDEHGMFTAMDFRKLNAAHMRLVVLSTCYSGSGNTEHSSAPFGLTLALLRQGVQAMVLSNRAIPDQETTEFMTAFYRQLLKVPDADAAFNNTLRQLKATKPQVDWSFMDLVH